MAVSKVSEIRLNMGFLTCKSRPYVTKAGQWYKDDLDKATYAEFVAKMNDKTSESRNRPFYAVFCVIEGNVLRRQGSRKRRN